jgi:hypothetical protein
MTPQHPITYIGMQKISERRWIHVGYDEATRTIVPMPRHLVPQKPEPKHP